MVSSRATLSGTAIAREGNRPEPMALARRNCLHRRVAVDAHGLASALR